MNLRLFGKTESKGIAKPAAAGVAAAPNAELEFAAAYARLYKPAVAYAAKRVGTLWAEDLVQDSFTAMWRAYYAKGSLPREAPERVLHRALRRRMAELLEREPEVVDIDAQHTIDITHQLHTRLDASHLTDENELKERIVELLATLPELTATVFQSAWRNDWDVAAAAAELRLNYDTARGHFLRAKYALAEPLALAGYSIPPLKPRGRMRDGGKTS
jgi:DNA-directed RNA polymerase specialized sigma24 family protein